MSDVVLRRFRDGDEEAVNRGFNRVFGHHRRLEEWRWKFPPEAGGRLILIAEEAGEVVAHFAALPMRLRIDDREVRAGQVVDAYSTRRQGLFVRLVHRFYERFCGPEPGRIALVYGFPGERHFRLGVRKLRYTEPLPVAFWSRGPAASPAGAGWLGRLQGWRVRRGPDAAAADRLWDRARSRYPVAAVRDGAWINRRFHRRPGVDYLHLVAERWGEPAALAVLRPPEGEGAERVLSWAELVWDGRATALLALDREVARLAAGSEARESHLWLANDRAAARLLAGRGWIRREHPQRLCLGAVPFRPDIDATAVCRRLYLTMGDGDLV